LPRLIRQYSDGLSVEFDSGNFDDFCVFVRDDKGSRYAPLDTEYFKQLLDFSQRVGNEKMYADFLRVYDATTDNVTNESLRLIEEIAMDYEPERVLFARTLTIIHMGMVAEINKKFTKLGKRIKRLGVHKLLVEGASIDEAANFMRGMNWKEIDNLCRDRGF
jgi:hypothetical protein